MVAELRERPSLIVLSFWFLFLAADCREYCQFETFNASCSASQIVVIDEARYGRLQLGRCVTRDYGFLGCSANVLDLLDRTCSGQRSCQFSIPTLRDLVQPCPKDLTSYLEASYSCVTVLDPTSVKCNETTFLNSSGPSLYLHYVTDPDQTSSPSPSPTPTSTTSPSSSYPSISMTTPAPTDAGVTAPFCPPAFSTQRGQRIDVTLYSFGQYRAYDSLVSSGGSESYHHLRPCPATAYVIDEGRRHSSALCQARHREQHIYTTNSSRAAVYFGRASTSGKHQVAAQKAYGNYLIRLQAVGCPDLAAPLNSWIERLEDRIIIRCNFSMETWYLTCKGNYWIGEVTNCSEASLPVKDEIAVAKKKSIPIGLVIAVIIGIIFGVILGLVMLFAVYLFKRRRVVKRQKSSKLNGLLDPEEVLLHHKENEDNYARKVYAAHRQRATHIYSHVCPGHSLNSCRHRCQTDCDAQLLEMRCCPAETHHVTPPPPPPLTMQSPTRHSLGGATEDTDGEARKNSSRRKHVQFVVEPETTTDPMLTTRHLSSEGSNVVQPVSSFQQGPSVIGRQTITSNNISNIFYNLSNASVHPAAAKDPPGYSADLCRPDLVQSGDRTLPQSDPAQPDGIQSSPVKGPVLVDWEGGNCVFMADCSSPRWPI